MTTIGRRILLVLSLLAALPALAQEDYDQWYVLDWSGQRAGWMHQWQETSDGAIVTRNVMALSLKRGVATIDLKTDMAWTETPDGRPVSIVYVQNLGAGTVTSTYAFKDGGVELTAEQQDGRASTKTLSVPEGEWLTPAAAARDFERRLSAGATEISQTVLQPGPFGLQVSTSTYAGIEETTVEVLGKVIPAYRAEVSNSALPSMKTVSYFTEEGVPVRDEIDMGMATITMVAADRAVATSDLDAPEVMASTFVEPSGGFDGNPRRVRRASYLMRVAEGEMPPIPETGVQRVTPVDASTVRVVVDLDDPRPAGDVDMAAVTGSSTLIDASDAKIVALAERALRGVEGDDAARAEALRRFVYRYVDEKSLGVGVATASEVCRTRQGDCTEHAVLLAALLRAAGIPSRTASGLVYVDQFLGQRKIFGYHMWAQALLDVNGAPTWVDVDGTLPGDVSMDATHIALAVSSMGDEEAFDGLVGMVPLMGNLEIEIEGR